LSDLIREKPGKEKLEDRVGIKNREGGWIQISEEKEKNVIQIPMRDWSSSTSICPNHTPSSRPTS
jgi:hypothetical protein